MIVNLVFGFLFILGIFIVDVQTMFFMLVVYLSGFSIVWFLNSQDKKNLIKIYQVLFCVGAFYMLACYAYMTYHGYEYLFSYDAIDSFLPNTQRHLESGNFISAINSIWTDYRFLDRNIAGYYTYSTTIGFIGNIINANFYVGQQISILFLFPFIGVVLYKLFLANKFNQSKSYKYTLIISCFSIIFFFSSMVTRDLHVLLLYLLAIYFTFKKDFSVGSLLKLILIIFICCIFRIESGLFLFILIPAYLLLSLQQSRQKIIVLIVSTIIGIITLSIVSTNYNPIKLIFTANQENYVNYVTEGSGVISKLQNIPIAGDLLSIIYNAVQPLPFWGHFQPPQNNPRVEMYNIMSFPESFASFFNWFVIVYILFWLFSKNLKKQTKGFISKPMKYNLWIGLVFLYMQSAVIAQRRLMGYYVVFYILFFIIYNNIEEKDRTVITSIAISSFIALQIFSLIYLM